METVEPRGFIEKGRRLLFRFGRRFGLVRVNRRTLRKPDEAKRTSENTVADQGIEWPVNDIQRVIAMGRTCHNG